MKASIVVSALSLLSSAAAFGYWEKNERMGCKGPCRIDTSPYGIELSCNDCSQEHFDPDANKWNTDKWKSHSGYLNSCFTNKDGKLVAADAGGGGGWDQSCNFRDVDAQGVIHAYCQNNAKQWVSASVKLTDAPLATVGEGINCLCFDCHNEITP